MMSLPKNINQISTYRNYLIVQQAPHNEAFPFPFYRMYSLETEREIYLPLLGSSIGWCFMEVHENGILFKTPIKTLTACLKIFVLLFQCTLLLMV